MKRKEKRAQRVKEKTEEVINAYRSEGTLTDPLGMYTGITGEVHDAIESACIGGKTYMNPKQSVPVQDADDL
ncbi:MAG: hypothetical protein IJB24_07790 [Clostridia bacterium]|nr:hypothetical protein [Clostridia bacterium]